MPYDIHATPTVLGLNLHISARMLSGLLVYFVEETKEATYVYYVRPFFKKMLILLTLNNNDIIILCSLKKKTQHKIA